MNRNKQFVITINRDLGSGGRSIGKRLAKRLKAEFFDKNIIHSMAIERNLLNRDPATVSSDDLYKAESTILREIGYSHSCIITGRSGFYAMKEHPNHICILIQAPMEYRIARIMRKQELSREQAMADIQQVDSWRENYIRKHTNTSRYDARNYDLVINMENLHEDDAMQLILDYIDKSC
jgi:cytidylate kinase